MVAVLHDSDNDLETVAPPAEVAGEAMERRHFLIVRGQSNAIFSTRINSCMIGSSGAALTAGMCLDHS